MTVQQYKSCKITVFVWGKDIILKSQISPLYFSWFYILLALHYLNAWKRLTINYFTYSVLQQKRIRQQHFTWGTKKDPLWLQRETKHMFDPALTKMGCCINIGINFSQNGSKLEHPSITHLKQLKHNLCRVDKSSQIQFKHMAYNNYSLKIAHENHYNNKCKCYLW